MSLKLDDRYMYMEWGYRASERGLNIQAAREEFRKLVEDEVGQKEERRAAREAKQSGAADAD